MKRTNTKAIKNDENALLREGEGEMLCRMGSYWYAHKGGPGLPVRRLRVRGKYIGDDRIGELLYQGMLVGCIPTADGGFHAVRRADDWKQQVELAIFVDELAEGKTNGELLAMTDAILAMVG